MSTSFRMSDLEKKSNSPSGIIDQMNVTGVAEGNGNGVYYRTVGRDQPMKYNTTERGLLVWTDNECQTFIASDSAENRGILEKSGYDYDDGVCRVFDNTVPIHPHNYRFDEGLNDRITRLAKLGANNRVADTEAAMNAEKERLRSVGIHTGQPVTLIRPHKL